MLNSSHQELFRRVQGSCVQAMPQSAAKVLELAKYSENGPPEYAQVISTDPGLTTQILRFVNSSFFGFQHKITTVQTALSMVHVRTIRNFILWNAVFALLPNQQTGPFQLKLAFQDALRRGLFCKVLASHLVGLDPEELFIAGLLQDLSIPILAQIWPKEYAEILTQWQKGGCRLSQLEDDRFGWNHAVAGAYLVETWGFGPELVRPIQNHILVDFDNDDSKVALMDGVVALSALIPSASNDSWKEGDDFFAAFYKVARKSVLIDSTTPIIDQLLAEVDGRYLDLLAITATPKPPIPLVDFQKMYLASVE